MVVITKWLYRFMVTERLTVVPVKDCGHGFRDVTINILEVRNIELSPYLANAPILYSLKTSENICF